MSEVIGNITENNLDTNPDNNAEEFVVGTGNTYTVVTLIDSREEMEFFLKRTYFYMREKVRSHFIVMDRSMDAPEESDAEAADGSVPLDAEGTDSLDAEEEKELSEDGWEEEPAENDKDADSIEITGKEDEESEDDAELSDSDADSDAEVELDEDEGADDDDFGDDDDDLDEEEFSRRGWTIGDLSVRQAAAKFGLTYCRLSPDCTAAEAYNKALERIHDGFVCFTNAKVYYERYAIRSVEFALRRYPSQKIVSLNVGKRGKMKRRKIRTSKQPLDTMKKLNLYPFAYFYDVELIGQTRFKETFEEETCTVFLLEMLQKTDSIAWCNTSYVRFTSEASANPKNYYGCREHSFYIDSIEQNYLPLLEAYKDSEEGVPVWLQRALINLLFYKVYSNYNARDKFVLIGDEIDAFFTSMTKALQYVDDSILMGPAGYRQYKIPINILNMFLYLKYNRDPKLLNREFKIKGDHLVLIQADQEYALKNEQKVTIQAINIEKDTVCVDAFFWSEMLYQTNPDALYPVLNGERIKTEHLDIYSYDKAFGVSVNKKYTFQFRVEKSRLLKNRAVLGFRLTLGDKTLQLPIVFNKPASRLNEKYRCFYWYLNDEYYIKYTRPNITVFKGGDTVQRIKNELALLYEIENKVSNKARRKQIRKLRRKYLMSAKKLKKRRIWLYFDKLYKGGDNGEYQFRHDFAKAKEDGVECYYIVNADAACYRALKKEFGKYILEYGTFKCMLYALAAEMIVATGPEIMEFVGFNKQNKDYFKDLFDAKLVCIAHGVTIQKNANVQNRLFDNTMYYTTSSKYEVNHILQPVYGYSEDQVALTGMARFDGLKNNDQKQILITPTWRINLVTARKARNAERGYFSEFKNSAYYAIYNSLINDSRLIEAAKEHGYKIVFLLHPLMSSQIDDYERNDYVEIMQATGDMSYEKILMESSLMVTDYSGVHYDFGYMRKPIIYYQPKEIPMRFEEGGMKFATMGFGPLTTDYDEAVNLICSYMAKGCELEEEYKKRADDFFAFDDFNNCDRIHDAIHSWAAK